MTPYAVKVGDITPSDLSVLDEATTFMKLLPEKSAPSCHAVCELWVNLRYPGVHQKGKWAKVAEHSWIELRPGVVLDLYPVAGVRPSLHVRLPIGDPYDATWRKP